MQRALPEHNTAQKNSIEAERQEARLTCGPKSAAGLLGNQPPSMSSTWSMGQMKGLRNTEPGMLPAGKQ